MSTTLIQLLNEVYGINEIAIVGIDYQVVRNQMNSFYIPNKVLLGGIKSIGRITGILVPFMACFYVIGGLAIILINIDHPS